MEERESPYTATFEESEKLLSATKANMNSLKSQVGKLLKPRFRFSQSLKSNEVMLQENETRAVTSTNCCVVLLEPRLSLN